MTTEPQELEPTPEMIQEADQWEASEECRRQQLLVEPKGPDEFDE